MSNYVPPGEQSGEIQDNSFAVREVSLVALWQMIQKKKWLCLVVGAACFAYIFMSSTRHKEVYQGSVTFRIGQVEKVAELGGSPGSAYPLEPMESLRMGLLFGQPTVGSAKISGVNVSTDGLPLITVTATGADREEVYSLLDQTAKKVMENHQRIFERRMKDFQKVEDLVKARITRASQQVDLFSKNLFQAPKSNMLLFYLMMMERDRFVERVENLQQKLEEVERAERSTSNLRTETLSRPTSPESGISVVNGTAQKHLIVYVLGGLILSLVAAVGSAVAAHMGAEILHDIKLEFSQQKRSSVNSRV